MGEVLCCVVGAYTAWVGCLLFVVWCRRCIVPGGQFQCSVVAVTLCWVQVGISCVGTSVRFQLVLGCGGARLYFSRSDSANSLKVVKICRWASAGGVLGVGEKLSPLWSNCMSCGVRLYVLKLCIVRSVACCTQPDR